MSMFLRKPNAKIVAWCKLHYDDVHRKDIPDEVFDFQTIDADDENKIKLNGISAGQIDYAEIQFKDNELKLIAATNANTEKLCLIDCKNANDVYDLFVQNGALCIQLSDAKKTDAEVKSWLSFKNGKQIVQFGIYDGVLSKFI